MKWLLYYWYIYIFVYIDWVKTWISRAKKIPNDQGHVERFFSWQVSSRSTHQGIFCVSEKGLGHGKLSSYSSLQVRSSISNFCWLPARGCTGNLAAFCQELYHSSTKVRIVRGIRGAVIMWEDNDYSIVFELSESGFKLLDGNTDNDF